MKVIAKKNRELALINAQNTQNENRAEIITLVVPEEYEDFNKKIVFITPDGNVWDVITNNEYKITNAITKYKDVDFYIWLTKEVDGETIDFRTKTKPLKFYDNQDASGEITPEEISGVTTVINLLEEEIEKVENLNIEATKIGDTTTVTITKKDGTTESVEINDGTDGQDGYTPQKGIDYFTEQDIEEIEGDILNEVYTKSETDTLLQEKADVEDIPDVSSFITKDVNDLTNYTLKTNTGSLIDLEINDTTYVVTLKLKNQDGTVISTDTIDLPLESVVVSGRYDNTTKKVILTLENGSEVDFSVADLVAGLQTEITSQNKLASDLIDDTNSGNKFVTTTEKQTWNNKYDKPNGGIPKTDLASTVQISLGKADTAIQEHQDISGKEDKTNKVTSIDNTSTDTQYPSAKCVYDSQEEQNTEIENLQAENERLRNTLPTTTGEGQAITLNKTAELEFKKPPLPMGNSEQFSTTGKNLFNGNDVSTTASSNWSVSFENETLTIVHKNTYFTGTPFLNLGVLPQGTYVISGTFNAVSLYKDNIYTSFLNNGNTFTADGASNYDLFFGNSNASTLTYEKMMIRSSSITDNTYEPYTGGTASPNPDYPQEITNVTGDVEVKVQNKNLCNGINQGYYLSMNTSICGKLTRDNGLVIKVDGTSNYTVSTKATQTRFRVACLNSLPLLDGSVTAYNGANRDGTSNSITINTNGYKYLIVNVTDLSSIQIEKGSTATPYTPHKEQAFTFPLGNEKLMLGDYLADDGIHHVRGQYVFTGSENIQKYAQSTYAFGIYANINTKHSVAVDSVLCNKLQHTNLDTIWRNRENTNNNLISSFTTGFCIMMNNYTDTNDLKEYLTQQYQNETPVIAEYELAEEVIVPYTSVQQEVYNEIKQALSYEEQTNISSNQNALFSVEAYQDSKVILAEKGTYSKPSTGIPKTDLASAVQTSLNKADSAIQEHQDISGKQDITDNTLTTINKTVPTAINEVNSIAKLANQAKSYSTYQAFINYLNTAEKTEFIPGQSFMIQTKLVPDLWVYSVENTSVQYTYTTDEDFITYTNQATGGQVGYYKLAQLETQKVDLTDYATKTYVNNLFNSIVDGDEVSY